MRDVAGSARASERGTLSTACSIILELSLTLAGGLTGTMKPEPRKA